MNTLRKDNTGYHLKHLFIGSEGTLGFVTKVAILCPPLPKATNLALLGMFVLTQMNVEKIRWKKVQDITISLLWLNLRVLWPGLTSFDKVLDAFRLARSNLAEILSSCELMDQVSVDAVHENLGISCPISNMPFYMLIETSGSNVAHDEEKLNKFLETCMNKNIITDGMTTSEPSKMRVRKDIHCCWLFLIWSDCLFFSTLRISSYSGLIRFQMSVC